MATLAGSQSQFKKQEKVLELTRKDFNSRLKQEKNLLKIEEIKMDLVI